jgi:hypothetical protein
VKVIDGLYMGSREQQSRAAYISSTGGKLVTYFLVSKERHHLANLQRCDILPLLSVLVKYSSLQKKTSYIIEHSDRIAQVNCFSLTHYTTTMMAGNKYSIYRR